VIANVHSTERCVCAKVHATKYDKVRLFILILIESSNTTKSRIVHKDCMKLTDFQTPPAASTLRAVKSPKR
jgi:hypothetical protein